MSTDLPHSCPNCGAAMTARGELEAEIERLRQAFGLATTTVPDMEIDVADPVGMMQRVAFKVDRMEKLAEMAWGLIANAYGGNWDLASEASGWKVAAERWRDAYHKTLPSAAAKEEEPA